jgi:C1A family cysteine protease
VPSLFCVGYDGGMHQDLDELEAPRARARGLGYIPDPDGDSDATTSARAHFGAPATLPAAADLSHLVSRVRDQGGSSSCVGQAVAAAVDIRLRAMVQPHEEASALALYALARAYDNLPGAPLEDRGTSPKALFRGASEWGVAPERVWPFAEAQINHPLPLDVVQAATCARLGAWYRVDSRGAGRIADLRHALVMGYPVVFAIQVDDAFDDLSDASEIGPLAGKPHGGHMLAIVGYDYNASTGHTRFRVLNSWGEQWGDRGFCWMSEARINDPTSRDFYVLQVQP